MSRPLSIVTSAFLLAMSAPLFAETNQENGVSEVSDGDTLVQAEAIMSALQVLSPLDGDNLTQAIASLMVQFTAVMEADDFTSVLEAWEQNLPMVLTSVMSDIDGADVFSAVEATQWISSGVNAPAVHFVMDTACLPCLEMFADLREKNDAGEIDLRVTVLPFVDENTFPISLALLEDRASAWSNMTGFLNEEITWDDLAVMPSLENEDLQALVEQDYDSIIETGIRSLPLTTFRDQSGEPRVIIGSMPRENIEMMLAQ